MHTKRRPVVLFRRPVRALLILGAGLTVWCWAFVPFIAESDLPYAMAIGGAYSFALAGLAIGFLLQVGSRCWWTWHSMAFASGLVGWAVTAIYGGPLELLTSGRNHWLEIAQLSLYFFLAFTVAVAAWGWLTFWLRKAGAP